jgi:hypothetical protein
VCVCVCVALALSQPLDCSEYTTIFRMAALAPAFKENMAAFEAVAEQQTGYSTNRIALTYPLPAE